MPPYNDIGGVAGILLAGGRSSRMGRNKALLPFGERRLIDHMLALLGGLGLAEIHVSGDLQGYDGIPDPAPFAGPASALRALLPRFAYRRGILAVPVDMPFLPPELLRALMRHPQGACYAGRPLPLYLPARAQLGEGASMRELIAPLALARLELPAEREAYFANLNTPEDWEALVES